MSICPSGHKCPAATKFCPECGAKVVAVAAAPAPTQGKCGACGAANLPTAKFCSTCGAAAGAGSPPPKSHLPSYKPPDHTGHVPVNQITVGQTEKPRGLPKYQPPNHTGPVPVVKEVTEGCYDGVYGEKVDISGK